MSIIDELQIKNITLYQLKKLNQAEYNIFSAFWEVKEIKYCFRCGSNNLEYCNNTGYCRNCLEFGKVIEASLFIQKKIKARKFEYKDRLEQLKLSELQEKADQFICNQKQDCLIHAVCGAGKTEIVFNKISIELQKNKYICFAIPRIDILYEIAKRLKYYFPKTQIAILNSQEEKLQNAQIYVMTTNQIIKFKNCFSLIIVDEVDAFPYEYNVKYDYGVLSAKKKDGLVIYLTSTPSPKLQQKNLATFVINRRWHNFLLPVPKLEYFNYHAFLNGRGIKKIAKIIDKYLKENKKQLLFFISNIKEGKDIEKMLQKKYQNIPFVCSKTKERKEIIEKFRKKEFMILMTTTILERGVTFENIDIIVLDAASFIYNKAALVQIAGRVNRKKEYQNGKVYFYYEYKTTIIKEAIKQIKKFNEKG